MANFSPAYAYPMNFAEPQYYGDARYPGNTVFATTGSHPAQKAATLEEMLKCPMAYVATGVVGAVLAFAWNYISHYKLIKKKKMKFKNLWTYPVQGLILTPAAMAGAFGLLYAYYNYKANNA